LSSDALLASLRARGREWPAPVERHASLGSSNDRLRQLAREGAPAWSVVIAERQTAGRGRAAHGWTSPPGNLYMSVLLRPALPPARLTLVPLACGLGVADALAGLGVEVRLKWPNDVLAAGRKLAGLLCEATNDAGASAVVVGIGVNVAADPARSAPELATSATWLGRELGTAPALDSVAAAVLAELPRRLEQLEAGAEATLLDAWRERSVPWWGQLVEVRSGGETLRGRPLGLERTGALVLETDDGRRLSLMSGEARELRLAPPEAPR
jgi:BirA family biotin operon repressor/biotin-[acetyl-CoA-carboxylase] ligase